MQRDVSNISEPNKLSVYKMHFDHIKGQTLKTIFDLQPSARVNTIFLYLFIKTNASVCFFFLVS